MKFKCEICEKSVETNDCFIQLSIDLNGIEKDEIGDLIYSPIEEMEICSLCAKHIHLILKRGIKEINKK